jgi:2-methylcitrate dehydratase PrpD
MRPKNELSRITIDLPTDFHKKLKALAAMQGKSMRKIVVDLIDEQLSTKREKMDECPYGHEPNKKTIKALKNVQNRKNLVKAKDSKDLFKKLGLSKYE